MAYFASRGIAMQGTGHGHCALFVALLSTVSIVLWAGGCREDQPIAPASEVSPVDKTAGIQMSNHFLLQFAGSSAEMVAAIEAVGGSVERVHPEIGMAKVNGLTDEQVAQLIGLGGIEAAARDFWAPWGPQAQEFLMESAEATEAGHVSDPAAARFFPCQWNMRQIDVPGAWAQGVFGDPTVKVAVLDSGTDPSHQDLVGRVDIAQSTSMLSFSPCGVADTGTFEDLNFHGTFVSGLITSNGIGIAGVAPHAQVVAVKVLRCDNFGSFADIIAGILYAANLPDVHVINMSIQAHFPKHLFNGAWGFFLAKHNEAIDYAVAQGKIVVVAAGNFAVDLDHNRDYVELPSDAGNAVGIWAGDIDGDLATYSNYGRSGTWVGAGGGDDDDLDSPLLPLPGCLLSSFASQDGIVAPCASKSIGFPGCATGNRYLSNGSGTSFAAPLVAGVAALVDGAHGGALSGERLREILSETADDLGRKGADSFFSHGRVNASNAVLWQVSP